MKKLIFTSLMYIMLCGSVAAQPQQPQPRQTRQPHTELSGEEYLQFQLNMLIKQLRLAEQNIEPFTVIYSQYSKKMEELLPQQHPSPADGPQPPAREDNKPPRKSDEEIEKEILESFDLAEKTNALKREYYFKFKEILTPQKILRMYNFERRLRERMIYESRRRDANSIQEQRQRQ